MLPFDLTLPPGGPLFLGRESCEGTERFSAVAERMPERWRECSSAALQPGRLPGPRRGGTRPPSTWCSAPTSGICHLPLRKLLSPALLHFVLPNDRCSLPNSQHLPGAEGGGRPCQEHPRYQSAAGALTLLQTQALSAPTRPALCLRVADVSSIMALIMLLWVSRFNSGFQTEFIVSSTALFPTWALPSCLKQHNPARRSHVPTLTGQPSLVSIVSREASGTRICGGILLSSPLPPFATAGGCILLSLRVLR